MKETNGTELIYIVSIDEEVYHLKLRICASNHFSTPEKNKAIK